MSLLREDGRGASPAAYTRVSQSEGPRRGTRPKGGWVLAQESKTFGNDQDGEKNEQDERAGGVFGDLSFAQILASALAAGVSFSLSSQIGVAGSLIGAIVGAAAATVSSSVLNNLFSKSAEAIKGAVGPDDSSAPVAEKPADSGAAGKTELMPHPVDAGKTVAAEASAATTQSVASSPADDTEVKFAPSGTRIAPASLRRAVHESQRRDTRKRLVVASVIAGVAAVLVSALLVNVLTEGKGIGTTPGRTQEATTQAQTTQSEAEKPQETTQPEKPTESEDTEGTGSTSETTADTSNSSTSDSATQQNSNASGTDSNSNSGSSNSTTSDNSGTGSGSNSTTDSSNSSGTGSSTTGTTSSDSSNGSTDTSNSGSTGKSGGTSSTASAKGSTKAITTTANKK